MASGEIEIVNLALTLHLGRSPIASFDPSLPEDPEAPSTETLMRLAYPTARDALLAEAPWGFAVRRVAPALLDPLVPANVPLYEFSKAYQLPEGGAPTDPLRCLRVLDTNLAPTWGRGQWFGWWGWPWPEVGVQGIWQIEGRTLVTNEADIKIRYVGQVLDVTLYPPKFTMALSKELAALVAYAITRDTNTGLRLRKEADVAREDAIYADAREGSLSQLAPDTTLTRVRQGGWW